MTGNERKVISHLLPALTIGVLWGFTGAADFPGVMVGISSAISYYFLVMWHYLDK